MSFVKNYYLNLNICERTAKSSPEKPEIIYFQERHKPPKNDFT